MTALEKAAELQKEAVNLLLAEREQIDARLEQLGHNKTALPLKKRGRPAKINEPFVQHDTIQSASPSTP